MLPVVTPLIACPQWSWPTGCGQGQADATCFRRGINCGDNFFAFAAVVVDLAAPGDYRGVLVPTSICETDGVKTLLDAREPPNQGARNCQV